MDLVYVSLILKSPHIEPLFQHLIELTGEQSWSSKPCACGLNVAGEEQVMSNAWDQSQAVPDVLQ